ncbi:hypothetical protein PXH66_08680 [Synoicihabitans lomoniglobus]|uniref:Uncharacterized protein n=2 Tax=Synoicihabitans lomoniglobus TaxID=2909285 RepID=A0AAF0CRU3_9BACT|nr:hypothetical protein PXH66_08680 [Opitutaceae bacterium LMO-M01]
MTSARIDAAYMLTLGRPATTAELANTDEFSALKSFQEVMTQIGKTRLNDAAETGRVQDRAWFDAYGEKRPSTAPSSDSRSYAASVRQHLKSLAASPEEYALVINRAYREVIRRDAYPEEIAYWHEHPDTLSYVLLVGCVEDWARRNQPGLMVTAGEPTISINCDLLTTRRLPPALAAEIRDTHPAGDDHAALILVPGGAHLASGGGMALVVVGSRD